MGSQLLMIEDDVRLAQMVAEYLAQSGMVVTHRADGASGLAQLQGPGSAPLPDLVILDLMLPDMDAWTCAGACARCPAPPPRCRC